MHGKNEKWLLPNGFWQPDLRSYTFTHTVVILPLRCSWNNAKKSQNVITMIIGILPFCCAYYFGKHCLLLISKQIPWCAAKRLQINTIMDWRNHVFTVITHPKGLLSELLRVSKVVKKVQQRDKNISDEYKANCKSTKRPGTSATVEACKALYE